ncbi:hypothetical protein [Paenibacillus sp. KS-LC4]
MLKRLLKKLQLLAVRFELDPDSGAFMQLNMIGSQYKLDVT